MRKIQRLLPVSLLGLCLISRAFAQDDGSVLPFPPVPTASVAGPTLEESEHHRRAQPHHLAGDAPNVLIILIDDAGFGLPDTFGGEVRTPNLSRVRDSGISFNAFHTTSICSPTRAALLTGRNHHRVGNGTIAERALDWDGYVGVIPHTSATVAQVLRHYGYKTAAFGKWHNTPTTTETAMGPFDRWPTGHGFDHFYGFIAGETSQWEPRLYENINPIEPPQNESYHLSEDLADQAIAWLHEHQAYSPDQPFFMYWAPGATHGPHHIFPEWADRYKDQFDDGWDAYRERVFQRQLELGWIPEGTELTPRAETMAAWDDIPDSEREFQCRLMEVFAGFAEHVDAQVGKLLDAVEAEGLSENTIVIYIWGDNGSSAEGQNGSISELLAQNNLPSTVEEQINVLEGLGGLDALGGPHTDNMYHAGWAWAGSTPFHHTKLVASHFGGTRNPMVVSWPVRIEHDATPRSQFHHVNDIAPTLYEIIGITPPVVVDGHEQDPIDGVSFTYTFDNPEAAGQKSTQYFENNASRGIYHDGWYACTFGPLIPWDTAGSLPGLRTWHSSDDVWELYDLTNDYSQAHDLATDNPDKVAELQSLFLQEAEANKVFPVGASLWTRLHPEDRITSPYSSWVFGTTTTRMPEFTAPGLGRESNHVEVDIKVDENASGVLYALGGGSGGVTLYMDEGHLVYDYNMLLIEHTIAKSEEALAAGEHTIVVDTTIARPGAAAQVVVSVDGEEVINTTVERTVPAAFTASETFDVSIDLGSPVSLDYYDRRPFRFDGEIDEVRVELK